MQEGGLQALKAAKYEKKFQSGMFDNMEQQEGWAYLMAKMFQLPRSEKYQRVVEAQRRLISRQMKAKLRRQMLEASRAKRVSKSLKGPQSQGMQDSKAVLQPSAGKSQTSNKQSNENAAKEAHEKRLERKKQTQGRMMQNMRDLKSTIKEENV